MRPFKHLPLSEFVLERLFYALSDPVRLEIVRRLAELGEASCGELDGGRAKSTMSHHVPPFPGAARCRTGSNPDHRHDPHELVA